jgi:hypothetical protein
MSGSQRPPLLALATFDNVRPGGVPVDELFQDLGGLGELRDSGWRVRSHGERGCHASILASSNTC